MTAYLGSGPYCYASSLAMMLGEDSPPPRVLEVLTGAPFGFALFEGTVPFFDPYGWSPEIGLDAAIDVLGWTCRRSEGRDAGEARARLTAALAEGPVLAGPLDMSLLLHQPGTPADHVADHYVVVLAIENGTVVLHDPHGHPYATLPVGVFLDAWRGEGVSYLDSGYRLRTGFSLRGKVSESEALRRSLPSAIRWLTGRADLAVPPGTLGGAAAVERLAEQIEAGLPVDVHDHLVHFAIRLGARRLADAATCLASLGLDAAATAATGQARLAGALQYPMVTGDRAAAAAILRRLAPTYERLAEALPVGSS